MVFTPSLEWAGMEGESDLQKLLAGMNPELREEEYVFATTRDALPASVPILGHFQEREGVTVILARREAERIGLPYTFPCRMITLNVHSSLEAVGFLAAVAAKLTQRGISSNTISAYYHDHLFVPVDQAEEALAALRELANG